MLSTGTNSAYLHGQKLAGECTAGAGTGWLGSIRYQWLRRKICCIFFMSKAETVLRLLWGPDLLHGSLRAGITWALPAEDQCRLAGLEVGGLPEGSVVALLLCLSELHSSGGFRLFPSCPQQLSRH